MASPGQCLRAHDCGAPVSREPDETVQSRAEFGPSHVVRASSKSGVPPSCISTIHSGLAKPAEVFEEVVGNATSAKISGKDRLGRPRSSSRCGVMADVREVLDSMRHEEVEKFLERTRRMSDGPDDEACSRLMIVPCLRIVRPVPHNLIKIASTYSSV